MFCLSQPVLIVSKLLSGIQRQASRVHNDYFFLFLNQNIIQCYGYSKELSHWDGSFEHPKQMVKMMDKKFCHFMLHTFWFIWMPVPVFQFSLCCNILFLSCCIAGQAYLTIINLNKCTSLFQLLCTLFENSVGPDQLASGCLANMTPCASTH